ncbi:hypothetical protein AB0C93_31605 [Streptomyces sp. NPDC048518]|uniref:hypothetical protein n=1 Tax=Streptomyces sp. NPDC048518 TaxID=3155029 RepID=UPI0033D3C1D1
MANGQCIATTQAMYSVASSAQSLETTVSVLTGVVVFLAIVTVGAIFAPVLYSRSIKRLHAQQHHTLNHAFEKEH